MLEQQSVIQKPLKLLFQVLLIADAKVESTSDVDIKP
jgi:hypothetical protein